jgi:hypothetical protein
MAKQIVFLVHGMGRYGRMQDGAFKPDQTGWFADVEGALEANYDTFIKAGMGKGVAFKDRFTLVRIEYDSIFETIRAAWKEQAESWSQLGLGHGVIGDIQNVLKQKDEDAFLWTHAADVAFYAIPTVRDAVKMHVIDQILAKLTQAIEAGPFDTWSVIAHSLGTAVIHDCLLLLQHRAETKFGDWLPPRSLCMIANVARALTNNDAAAYDDAISPSGPGRPDYYLNCNHELDPFTRIDPFAPASGGWVAPGSRYRNLSTLSDYLLEKAVVDWAQDAKDFSKFAALVPHGFTHYLAQPAVVSNLWGCLLSQSPAHFPEVELAVRHANQGRTKDEIATILKNELSHLITQAEAAQEKTIGSFLKILQRAGGL